MPATGKNFFPADVTMEKSGSSQLSVTIQDLGTGMSPKGASEPWMANKRRSAACQYLRHRKLKTSSFSESEHLQETVRLSGVRAANSFPPLISIRIKYIKI